MKRKQSVEEKKDKTRWIGLDIGATKILGISMNNSHQMLGSLKLETLRQEGPGAVVERAASLCRTLIERHGPASGIGVGFAGLVDWKKGRVSSSIMLPGWEAFPLASTLSAEMDELPVFVDNDATAAGYGEYIALGSPSGLNMVLLTVGTGIGGAIIIDGRIFRGATGTSAEFGNTSIDWHGKTCWCGNKGCLNMLASGSAISEKAHELAALYDESLLKGLPEPISVEKISEAASRGDAAAARAIEEGARALGAGVANLINIFNPDQVVLTGGVSVLGERYLDLVKDEASARAFDESADHARISMSIVGTEVGALGAAGLIMDHIEKKKKDE